MYILSTELSRFLGGEMSTTGINFAPQVTDLRSDEVKYNKLLKKRV